MIKQVKRISLLMVFALWMSCNASTEAGKADLEGWWQILPEKKVNTDPFLSQLFTQNTDINEPLLINIDQNTIEIPKGISFSPSRNYGHFIDFKLDGEKITIQNPADQKKHTYNIDYDKEGLNLFDKATKNNIAAKRYNWTESPDSNFQMKYLSLKVTEDNLAHKEDPENLFIKVYNNQYANIEKLYLDPEKQNLNSRKKGKLSEKDYEYLITLIQRINWSEIAPEYAAKGSDLPTLKLSLRNKQFEKTVVIKDKNNIPYQLKWLLDYLIKGAENWEIEIQSRG